MGTELKEPTLTKQDRCDAQCDAQARVLVKGLAGELLFCGHHYTKFENKLNDFAYEIVDEREFIK